MLYSDDEGESDDDSRLAVTTAWGLRVARRGSIGLTQNFRNIPDSRERLALDITLLKQQYAKLRERQRQAHIILTAACARQNVNPNQSSAMQMNQFLLGRSAILPKGRRIGPPPGSVPPARKIIAPKPVKSNLKPPKRGETLHWKDAELTQRRKNSLKWKELNAERAGSFNQDDVSEKSDKEIIQSTSSASSLSNISDVSQSSPSRARKKSESSSYSEESDEKSSTSTSLCDDENFKGSQCSSLEQSPIKKKITPEIEVPEGNKSEDIQKYIDSIKETFRLSDDEEEIDDVIIEETKMELIEIEKENLIDIHFDEKNSVNKKHDKLKEFMDEILVPDDKEEMGEIDGLEKLLKSIDKKRDMQSPLPPIQIICSSQENSDISSSEHSSLNISSISQLSPIPDISKYISMSSISPLRTPSSIMDYSDYMSNVPSNDSSERSSTTINLETDEISYEGVTNELFERMNSTERPTRLDIPVTELGMHKSFSEICSIDSQQPSCSSSSYTIELQVKNVSPIIPACTDISSIKSPMKTSFHEMDRLKFLKEKSFSLDEPAKDRETIQATSCPEIRAEVVSKKNSDRVLKIIQENSMILHRILKKNSSDSLIEEVSEEEKKEQNEETPTKMEDKTPDFHFKEFTSFVKNSPSIEKLFEETFDEPNSEKSSKMESPEYISKESKAIVEKFPSFEKLSEFSSFEGRENSYEERIKINDKIYSPDYLSSESRDTSVPELKSFEIDNESREAPSNVFSPRENDPEDYSKYKEGSISKENTFSKKSDSPGTDDQNLTDQNNDFETFSRLMISSNIIEKLDTEAESDYTKFEKNEFDSSSKYDNSSKLSDYDENLAGKNEVPSNNSDLYLITRNIESSVLHNPEKSNIYSKTHIFEYVTKYDSLDYGESLIKQIGDSATNPDTKLISKYDHSPKNIENKEMDLQSSYQSSKIQEKSLEIESDFCSKIEAEEIKNIEINKKINLEPSYQSSKNREKSFEFVSDFCSKFKKESEESNIIETKEMILETTYLSSKNLEKSFEFDSDFCSKIKNNEINLELINREKSFEYDSDFTSKIKIEAEHPKNIEYKEMNRESSYLSLKNREKSLEFVSDFDSKIKIEAKDPKKDYFSYKSKLDDFSEDSSTNRNTKFEYSASSYTLNLNRDFSDSQLEFQPKNPANISDTLSSIENTIQTINNLCQVKDVPIVSVEDTDPNKNLSIKQFLTENSDWNHSRERSSSRSHRDYKRDASPRHRRDEEIEEYQSRVSRRDPSVATEKSETSFDFYNKSNGKRIPERPEIRHTTVTCTFYDRYLSQKLEKNLKLDKSPSSPVITKSYLESLRPTSTSSDRIVKSAENSPSRQKYDSPTIARPVISSLHNFDLNKKEVQSCDNILEKVTRSSRNFSPLPLKPHSPSELSLKLGLYKTPSPIKTTPKS